jgi:hypothetical protein
VADFNVKISGAIWIAPILLNNSLSVCQAVQQSIYGDAIAWLKGLF